MIELELSPSERVFCAIRYSNRAKHMSIRVRRDGSIELVMPPSCSEQDGIKMLRQEREWIAKAIRKCKRLQAAEPASARLPPPPYPQEIELACLERTLKFHYEWLDVPWVGAKIDPDTNIVFVRGKVMDTNHFTDVLLALLRNTAQVWLPPMLLELAHRLGFPEPRVSIRFQHRRWGSCSSSGGISLNGFLLLFPHEIVEYVMIHELCHMRHMNHSAAFHEEVRKYCPREQELHARLNAWAAKLTLPEILLKK